MVVQLTSDFALFSVLRSLLDDYNEVRVCWSCVHCDGVNELVSFACLGYHE